jgi:glycosyltransferase involved in cell wall biosynthesis/SAM-dependent methyltransferase
MRTHACTIIARNYLPAARVLAKSFRKQHSSAQFTVLIVDDVNAQVDDVVEGFDILRPQDIGIEPDEVLRMAAIYEVTEFCTAVKPWLLQTLLEAGADAVVYLDPDIKVFARLDEVEQATQEVGIVLTPHVTKPMPRDGLSTSETDVLLSGIYNLGFIAVTKAATDFLSFWKIRLRRDCIRDPENMRFVDQRWVDFVPGLYPVHIIRDSSYNVAYWNLDHRDLTYRDGRYLVDGDPLHFYHFSGYSPTTPYLLSKHQGPRYPRILLSDHPVVARICDEYGTDLLDAGYGEEGGAEYAFTRLANGLVLDVPMRRLYRSALLAAERSGAPLPPNPLQPGQDEVFLDYLVAPNDLAEGQRLSRYLTALHAARSDLQRAFPDPEGGNFLGFASWAHHEVQAGRLDPRLARLPVPPSATRFRLNAARQLERVGHQLEAVPVPGTGSERVRLNLAGYLQGVDRWLARVPLPPNANRARLNVTKALGRLERRAAAIPVPGTDDDRVRLNLARVIGRLERRLAAVPAAAGPSGPTVDGSNGSVVSGGGDLLPGIRVAGYLRAESGVGQLGRLAVATAQCAGLTTSTYVDSTAVSRQTHPFDPSGPDFNVNLICVNADELPNFAKRVGQRFFADHYTIGLWAWETEDFPARFAPSFDYVDEVWSISEFARQAIASASTKPVYAFPLPIVEPKIAARLSRSELGLPEGFLFLFCFDMLSIFERKNPLGLIEAFSEAFRPGEGPTLVIKVINGALELGSLERLKQAAGQRRDVVVIDEYLEHEANAALMAACDCYVSLHRSEGFGLTMAEAMALGKPVIATGYSGNLDFMTSETVYLVPWTYGTVPAGCSPYPAGARWADPDLEVAARFMREVFEHPWRATELGEKAKAFVLANHGIANRAQFMTERFVAAQEQLRRRGALDAGPRKTVGTGSPSLVDVAASTAPVDAPSKHPRSARAFRRVVWRLLQSHDDYDRYVRVQMAKAIDETHSELNRLTKKLTKRTRRLVRDEALILETVASIETTLQSQQRRLEVQEKQVAELDEPLRWRKIDAAIRAEEELHAIPYMSNPDVLVTEDHDGRPAIGYRPGELDKSPLSFEEMFRGPEDMIRDRFRAYLPILAGHAPVVDIGCGRGELLDLLAEAEIESVGVDVDPSMVNRAKAKGHHVVEQDAVEYLRGQSDSSLGAVFSAQVIEHLPADMLLRLLQEAHRTLHPGGLLVLETVNPYSIQAFKAFWTDLTHRNPIYPEALVVYCAEAGFDEAIVIFPNGTGKLEVDRWSAGEYSVVAVKSAGD